MVVYPYNIRSIKIHAMSNVFCNTFNYKVQKKNRSLGFLFIFCVKKMFFIQNSFFVQNYILEIFYTKNYFIPIGSPVLKVCTLIITFRSVGKLLFKCKCMI